MKFSRKFFRAHNTTWGSFTKFIFYTWGQIWPN